jgi:hypothetical protein
LDLFDLKRQLELVKQAMEVVKELLVMMKVVNDILVVQYLMVH